MEVDAGAEEWTEVLRWKNVASAKVLPKGERLLLGGKTRRPHASRGNSEELSLAD